MSMESNKVEEKYSEDDVNGQEEFSFLQETIKKKPVTLRTIANQLGKMIAYGIVFGLVASLSFFTLKPWAETKFQKNPGKVVIPKDEENELGNNNFAASDTVDTLELTLDNYRQMSDALYQVARDADKSIVEIRGIHGKEGWVRETYDTVNSVSGVIIADTGSELLLLANDSVLEKAESMTVTFRDGNTYNTKLRSQDKNLGIAIFSVEKSEMQSGTLKSMKVAVLGNSNLVKRGNTLIALGKPFGYTNGIGYGVASSTRKKISLADGNYNLILSDIPGNKNGNGFFINLDGEIVGMIQPKVSKDEDLCTSNALAISSIKESIERLSNGKSVPYIGILGIDVTEEIENAQGIPMGVYVENVEPDSPAMLAGIQSGDVITFVEKKEITTLDEYQDVIAVYKAGQQIKLSGKRRGNDGYVDIEFEVTVGNRE